MKKFTRPKKYKVREREREREREVLQSITFLFRPCLYGETLARGPEAPTEPTFPTIAYKSSSTVYTRNCKPGSEGRVTLRVGSLGWQDKVTLGGEPNFSRVNGFKRVNRAKSHHAEHEQVDISVP